MPGPSIQALRGARRNRGLTDLVIDSLTYKEKNNNLIIFGNLFI